MEGSSDFVDAEIECAIDNLDTWDPTGLTVFGADCAITQTFIKRLSVHGEKLQAMCQSASEAVGDGSPVAHVRFAGPGAATEEEYKTMEAAEEWKAECMLPIVERIGAPLKASTFGLPWLICMKVPSYVGDCSTIPLNFFGGWLRVLSGKCDLGVIMVPSKLCQSSNPLNYLHQLSNRSFAQSWRHKSIRAARASLGELIYVAPGGGIVLMPFPIDLEFFKNNPDQKVTIEWFPHLSKQMVQKAEVNGGIQRAFDFFNSAYSAASSAKNENWKHLSGFSKFWRQSMDPQADESKA